MERSGCAHRFPGRASPIRCWCRYLRELRKGLRVCASFAYTGSGCIRGFDDAQRWFAACTHERSSPRPVLSETRLSARRRCTTRGSKCDVGAAARALRRYFGSVPLYNRSHDCIRFACAILQSPGKSLRQRRSNRRADYSDGSRIRRHGFGFANLYRHAARHDFSPVCGNSRSSRPNIRKRRSRGSGR